MEITINARHDRVPDSLRNQATQRLTRMQRLHRRLTGAVIVLETERGKRRAEARLAVAGGPPLIGHGEGATLRAALDGALERLERQLKRQRDRVVARRTRDARKLVAP
jgi:putative sigma-54 modulation protein